MTSNLVSDPQRNCVLHLFVLTVLPLVLLAGCNGSAGVIELPRTVALNSADGVAGSPPSAPELIQLLNQELAGLGIDPQKTTTEAPSQGSEVIDLEAAAVDPDGSGPLEPTGYQLTWTERLVGDYDQNGEVNVADLSALAAYWAQPVSYDDPRSHDGIDYFPVGDPQFDGDVEPTEPPVAGSGAYNWRRARVDGDGNAEISITDITPIAAHFTQRLDGYRIYRRQSGEFEFTVLEDPDSPGTPVLITRSEANGGEGISGSRPVLYEFTDESAVDGAYDYRVVPYDSLSGLEGPASHPGFDDAEDVDASIVADITQGMPPLTVEFDASASISLTSPIADYSWDLDGDGILDAFTGSTPFASREYEVYGSWLVSVEVTNEDGESDVASVLISITSPPTARLSVSPAWLEVPLVATVDASTSSDADGEVVGYEWDLDGDGEYELDSGPVASRQIEVTAAGELTFGVRARDNDGATGSTSMAVQFADDYAEEENNDSAQTGMKLGVIPIGESRLGLTGSIGNGLYDGDDVDWFKFELEQAATVDMLLEFEQAAADLTLALWGPESTSLLAISATHTDNESTSAATLIAGTYYIQVSREVGPGEASSAYVLSLMTSELIYDELENNDSSESAQDLGNIDAGLLPQFVGSLGPGGYDGDSEDWLAFSIGAGAPYRITLQFFHRAADLELQLYGNGGAALLGSASSVSDNEELTIELVPGNYLVRCFRYEGGHANYSLSILYE